MLAHKEREKLLKNFEALKMMIKIRDSLNAERTAKAKRLNLGRNKRHVITGA